MCVPLTNASPGLVGILHSLISSIVAVPAASNSVTDTSRRPFVTAVVAGELSEAWSCACGQARDMEAVVLILKVFRGYLARVPSPCFSQTKIKLNFAINMLLHIRTEKGFRSIHCFLV